MIVTPDVTVETFEQNKTSTTTASRKGLDVVFIENVFDPEPGDERYEATIVYLIREQGHLRVETDRWSLGLFTRDVWRRTLREVGFEVVEETFVLGSDTYAPFACIKKSCVSAN